MAEVLTVGPMEGDELHQHSLSRMLTQRAERAVPQQAQAEGQGISTAGTGSPKLREFKVQGTHSYSRRMEMNAPNDIRSPPREVTPPPIWC